MIGVNGACRLTHHAETARRLLFLLVLLCKLLLLRLLRILDLRLPFLGLSLDIAAI